MANKGFDLASVLGNVSNLDTGREYRERIEYIDIDLIDGDERNFYGLVDIDALAENIELVGLQQPIRVRPNPDAAERYIIVSGHRRRAAIRKLVDEGNDSLREVPCIIELAKSSNALQELKLIYANSDTRRMTSPEINKQAERVEMLLYQLREEGMEFPGRMRDHVAEACKISASKLARLKVIRENLDEVWKKSYEDEILTESAAYALAQAAPEYQRVIFENLKKKDGTAHVYEYEVRDKCNRLAAVDKLSCKKQSGCQCTNREEKRIHTLHIPAYSAYYCDKCCDKCPALAKCKQACPLLADKVKKLKEDAKAQRKQEAEAQAEKERPAIEEIKKYWKRFGEARKAAGKSVKECFDAMDIYYGSDTEKNTVECESLEAKFNPNTNLPYGYSCSLVSVQRYVNVADLLGVSLDYLLCRTDNPNGIAPVNGWMPLQWLPARNKPHGKCRAVAKFVVPGMEEPMINVSEWDGTNWRFLHGATIDAECLEWFPLPEDDAKKKTNCLEVNNERMDKR